MDKIRIKEGILYYYMTNNGFLLFFINLWFNYHIAIITAFIAFVITIFILDKFKFSDVKFIKYLQYSVLGILFLYIYINYLSQTVYSTNGDDPIVSTTVTFSKEGLEHVGDGIRTVGSNIGLGATVGGTAGAVAAVIKSAPIPPVQKVAAVLVGAVVGGAIHVGVTAINTGKKNKISESSNIDLQSDLGVKTESSSKYVANSPLEANELLTSNTNYVEDLLYSMLILNTCTLILFLLFLLSLINKFILMNNINLTFMDKIFSKSYSEKLNNFILYFYKLFGSTNNIYSIFLIILILVSCLSSIYFIYELIDNFEQFSRDYLDFLNKLPPSYY